MVVTDPEPAPRTMSLEEACRDLGIGRSMGYSLARRGQFPGLLKLGRRFLVSRPAFERYIQQRNGGLMD
jgi:excisionase family DNA binding protein